MSVQAISWVLEHSESEGKTRCVLIAIANQVGGDGSGWLYVSRILRESRCSLDTYRRAIAWASEHGELERDINQGDAAKAPPNRKPNRFRFLQMGGANLGGADCRPQQNAGPNLADPDPSLSLDPALSSSSDLQEDDERIDAILRLFAERQAAKHATTNAAGFKRTALRNARIEHTATVRKWLNDYDVSDTQVADALVAGTPPPSWNNYRSSA